MASLSALLVDLIPFYGFQGELADSNIAKLKEPLLRLKKVSHHLEGKVGKSKNPLFNSGAKFLSNETNRALAAIEEGDIPTAVKISKHLVGACITCHTQIPSKSQLPSSIGETKILDLQRDPQVEGSSRQDKLELANFFVATRQYDKAMDAYNEVLTDTSLPKLDEKSWYEATVRSIAVAVRVKKNPSLALEMISSIFDAKAVPEKMKANARYWQQALKAWRSEIQDGKDFSTGSDFLKLDRVETFAKNIEQKTKSEKREVSRFLIERLRISMVVNEMLATGSLDKEQGARAYYLVGRNSRGLEQVDISSPALFYLQACVRSLPKTKLAKNCFTEYETIVVIEKSPSSRIPAKKEKDVVGGKVAGLELDELRDLAFGPSAQ